MRRSRAEARDSRSATHGNKPHLDGKDARAKSSVLLDQEDGDVVFTRQLLVRVDRPEQEARHTRCVGGYKQNVHKRKPSVKKARIRLSMPFLRKASLALLVVSLMSATGAARGLATNSAARYERLTLDRRSTDNQEIASLPPPLAKLYNTPFLSSEIPSGFKQTTVLKLPADPRYHSLGAVRFDFKNANSSATSSSVSASYALFKTSARAAEFSRFEAKLNTRGLFRISATSVGRIAVGVTGFTQTQANRLLQLALAHLRRSER
jgi:hypothetical protein